MRRVRIRRWDCLRRLAYKEPHEHASVGLTHSSLYDPPIADISKCTVEILCGKKIRLRARVQPDMQATE